MNFGDITSIGQGLAGFAAVLALLVNVGKQAGWIKDGDAGAWYVGGQLGVTLAVYVLAIVSPGFDWGTADNTAAQLAQAGALLLSAVGPLVVGALTHKGAKGLPVVGFSFPKG